jgi:hypothetical protein
MNRALALLALALTAAATPHKVVRNTPALEFHYEWPAEAAAIPALDLRFYTEAKRNLAEALKNAGEDQALAKQQKRDFNPHSVTTTWTTRGETPRLLSLSSDNGSDEGGAHPNSGTGSLLWDRKLDREISVNSLFASPAQFAAVTRRTYCKKLDAERAKRREGFKPDLPEFNACPKFSELAIYPAAKNKNGRFDRMVFVASPYVAGPYVEGEYEITLPVTSQLIAALKPEYRPSLEVQRQ